MVVGVNVRVGVNVGVEVLEGISVAVAGCVGGCTTEMLAWAVLCPPGPLTIKTTRYWPGDVYKCTGLRSVLYVPSPKFQL